MPLPSIVLDTYLRYKNGTKTFVQWLASSARATGTVEDLFTDPVSGRKKGKARKESKAAPSPGDEPIHIPLSSYDKLANAVVSSLSSSVPKPMLDILRDAISKREECADYYARKRASKSKYKKSSADAGHQYCISVLKATLEILLRKDTSMRHSEKEKGSIVSPDLADHFLELKLKDSSANKPCTPEETPDSEPRPIDDIYASEPTKEDLEFAFFCMMKDVTDIRFFVRRTWRKHKAGHITLETAAVTMNAAIQIVEQMNMAFLKSFSEHPEFEHHWELLQYIWDKRWAEDATSASGGDQEWEVAYTDGVQEIEYPSFSLSQVSWLIDHWILIPLLEDRFDNGVPRIFTDHTPLADYELRFWKTLVQLAITSRQGLEGLPEDYVLKAMKFILTERACPTWAVFAMQCVRDTQLELGPPPTGDFKLKELRATTDWLMRSLICYGSSVQYQNVTSWHDSNWPVVNQYYNQMTLDMMGNFMESILKATGTPIEGRLFNDYDFLLENYHMLQGLYGQGKLLALHRWATITEANHGVIKTVAHLYNAAQMTKSLPEGFVWDDMDQYLQEMGDERIFKGARPRGRIDFHACFLRVLGCQTLNTRLSKQEAQKANCALTRKEKRHLAFTSRYVQICSSVKGGQIGLSEAFDDPKLLADAFCTGDDASIETPAETLTKLATAIQEDQYRLRFNIMRMWAQCNRLLNDISKSVMRKAPLDYPASEYGHGLGPIMVASNLLHELSGLVAVNRPQFSVAVKLMHQLILNEGSIGTKAASDQTRSSTIKRSLTEEKEPSFENPPEDSVSFEDRIEYYGKKRFMVSRRGRFEEAFVGNVYLVNV